MFNFKAPPVRYPVKTVPLALDSTEAVSREEQSFCGTATCKYAFSPPPYGPSKSQRLYPAQKSTGQLSGIYESCLLVNVSTIRSVFS